MEKMEGAKKQTAFCDPSSAYILAVKEIWKYESILRTIIMTQHIWYYEWANTADFKILFKSYRFVNTKSFPIFKSLFTFWWDNVFIGIKEDFLRKYFVFLTKSISIFFVLIVLIEEGGRDLARTLPSHIVHNPIFHHGLDSSPSPPIGCFTRGRTRERLGTTMGPQLIICEEDLEHQ